MNENRNILTQPISHRYLEIDWLAGQAIARPKIEIDTDCSVDFLGYLEIDWMPPQTRFLGDIEETEERPHDGDREDRLRGSRRKR